MFAVFPPKFALFARLLLNFNWTQPNFSGFCHFSKLHQRRDHVRDILENRKLPRRAPTFPDVLQFGGSLPGGLLASSFECNAFGRSPRHAPPLASSAVPAGALRRLQMRRQCCREPVVELPFELAAARSAWPRGNAGALSQNGSGVYGVHLSKRRKRFVAGLTSIQYI